MPSFPKLLQVLDLDRCPHCNVDQPSLELKGSFETVAQGGPVGRQWGAYACKRCGGGVLAWAISVGSMVQAVYPEPKGIPPDLPARAATYLEQALASIHIPSGAVMLAASAIDAMLKAKGYLVGSLYSRIDNAANDHVITPDMARWAHDVRLDANDERHADQDAPMPSVDDASRCVDFATALAEILFTLPARVQRAISAPSG